MAVGRSCNAVESGSSAPAGLPDSDPTLEAVAGHAHLKVVEEVERRRCTPPSVDVDQEWVPHPVQVETEALEFPEPTTERCRRGHWPASHVAQAGLEDDSQSLGRRRFNTNVCVTNPWRSQDGGGESDWRVQANLQSPPVEFIRGGSQGALRNSLPPPDHHEPTVMDDIDGPPQFLRQFSPPPQRRPLHSGPSTEGTGSDGSWRRCRRPPDPFVRRPHVSTRPLLRVHMPAAGLQAEPLRGGQVCALDHRESSQPDGRSQPPLVYRRHPPHRATEDDPSVRPLDPPPSRETGLHYPPDEGLEEPDAALRFPRSRNRLPRPRIFYPGLQDGNVAATMPTHLAAWQQPQANGARESLGTLDGNGNQFGVSVTNHAFLPPEPARLYCEPQIMARHHPSLYTGTARHPVSGNTGCRSSLDPVCSSPDDYHADDRRVDSRRRRLDQNTGGSTTRSIVSLGPEVHLQRHLLPGDASSTSVPPSVQRYVERYAPHVDDRQHVCYGVHQQEIEPESPAHDGLSGHLRATPEDEFHGARRVHRHEIQLARRPTQPSFRPTGLRMDVCVASTGAADMVARPHARLLRIASVSSAAPPLPLPIPRRPRPGRQHLQLHVAAPRLLADTAFAADRRLLGEGQIRPMPGRLGRTRLASSAVVPTSSAALFGINAVRRPRLLADQRLQPGSTRVLAEPVLAMETVSARWVAGLNTGARRLWQGILNFSPAYSPLGRFAGTRRFLTLGRLAPSSWNTYASSFRSFLAFLQQEGIELREVTEMTLEMYVCFLTETPGKIMKGVTVASNLSGIRSCLKELGIHLEDPSGTSGALAGYKRFSLAVHPASLQHAAWPIEFTVQVLRHGRAFLPLFRAGRVTRDQHTTVVSAAHVVFGTLTFSRGHTSNNVDVQDLDVTDLGFAVALRLQKRPQDRLPQQQHRTRPGSEHRPDPVQFLLDYFEALQHLGSAAASPLFPAMSGKRLTLDAAVKHLVALCDLRHSRGAPLTGHTVRVGAVTAAFGIGVPLATCAYMCAHKHTTSTEGYIRHGFQIDSAAFQYFGHLRPRAGSGQSV